MPSIGGFSEYAIIDLLESYRIGFRLARPVTLPDGTETDAVLAKRGAEIHDTKCGKWHSEGGSFAEDDLAILASQWREYLEMEFEDFDSGTRRMVAKMKAKFETLSDADKAALLEFYVSAGNH